MTVALLATLALMPLGESSNTTQHLESKPKPSAASRKGSGAGLPAFRGMSSAVMVTGGSVIPMLYPPVHGQPKKEGHVIQEHSAERTHLDHHPDMRTVFRKSIRVWEEWYLYLRPRINSQEQPGY